ncbi:LRR receptor-like serine/threonine-protein kinase FEI 1 [Eucalyptus grandis]|uniref:LRR receptor-like serine/threonine-protein kinase FEI 1 n=1 Tax=Eucalyptus grandis TaxID=71139 RepID=UPI00192E8D46|nr:LRR receptor-like serine/threonine-protein kinase FEI 1 [Eucalyptus grandis]
MESFGRHKDHPQPLTRTLVLLVLMISLLKPSSDFAIPRPLVIQGNASERPSYLSPSQPNGTLNGISGQATYSGKVHFWDKATGNVVDCATQYTASTDSQRGNPFGDAHALSVDPHGVIAVYFGEEHFGDKAFSVPVQRFPGKRTNLQQVKANRQQVNTFINDVVAFFLASQGCLARPNSDCAAVNVDHFKNALDADVPRGLRSMGIVQGTISKVMNDGSNASIMYNPRAKYLSVVWKDAGGNTRDKVHRHSCACGSSEYLPDAVGVCLLAAPPESALEHRLGQIQQSSSSEYLPDAVGVCLLAAPPESALEHRFGQIQQLSSSEYLPDAVGVCLLAGPLEFALEHRFGQIQQFSSSEYSPDAVGVCLPAGSLEFALEHRFGQIQQFNTSGYFHLGLVDTVLEHRFGEKRQFSSSLQLRVEKDTESWLKSLLGGAIVLVAIIVAWVKYKTERGGEEGSLSAKLTEEFEKLSGTKEFSFKELMIATNSFARDRILGEGGSGIVYKGHMGGARTVVAVKKIKSGSRQGIKEYVSEVKSLSQLRHRNLVQLIGYCHKANEFILVYEFMRGGSLEDHLFKGRPSLTWERRYSITLGLASAVYYLHKQCNQCVIHRDIKSSNIMLDERLEAKLGDFGLARLVDHAGGLKATDVVGTPGYVAPEYHQTGEASKESDIYSFGVVLLEIVCGRRVIEDQCHIVVWVREQYGRGKLPVDLKLGKNFNKKQAKALMIVTTRSQGGESVTT